MKFKFIFNGRVWWLILANHTDIDAYIRTEWPRIRDRALKDFDYHIEHNVQGHWSDGLAESIFSLMAINQIPVSRQHFEHHLDAIIGAKLKGWVDHINSGKTIYVNSNGGFNFGQPVLAYEERTECSFPCYRKEDIRIKQWPGGKHYYAYVGNIEVTEQGKEAVVNKWNSKEEALNAAMKLLNYKR